MVNSFSGWDDKYALSIPFRSRTNAAVDLQGKAGLSQQMDNILLTTVIPFLVPRCIYQTQSHDTA